METAKNEEKSKCNDDHHDDNMRCGYCNWEPDCLQRFNTPRWLLASLCWFMLIQGFVVNGVIYVNFSAWERLFGLDSQQLGWISSAYNVSATLFTIVFAYLGQFIHNGNALSISAFAMGCGSFVMFLPHVLSDNYVLGPLSIEYCELSGNSTSVECLEENSSNFFWYIIVGQLLHGVGGGALFTLSIPYLDDQVKYKNTPLYIGIITAFSALGPACGYIFGGLLLNIYVDVGRVDEEIELEPTDPRWVGAWWIGLVFSSTAAFTVAALMACFPRLLPSGLKYKSQRGYEAYKGIGIAESARDGFGRSAGDVWLMTKQTFTNPSFVLLTVSGIVEMGAATGFASFLPKIITFQFNKSAAEAAVAAGIVVIPSAAGGQFLGGLIPKWLQLKVRGLLVQCAVLCVLALVLSPQFLLRCQTPSIAGVTVPYFNTSMDASYDTLSEPNVYHPCNQACNCSMASYDPVCGSDNIEYFTPCFAGCTDEVVQDELFSSCSCVDMEYYNSSIVSTVSSGICPAECDIFYLFLTLFFFIILFTFMMVPAGQSATIRLVPPKHKAYAFGIQWTLVRILGTIPGPIIFGLVFDKSCLIWQDICGERGSCWIYDSQFLAQGICWAIFIAKCISSICFCLALYVYKPPPTSDDDEKSTTDSVQNDQFQEEKSSKDLKDTSVFNGNTKTNATDFISNESHQKKQINLQVNEGFESDKGVLNTHL